MNSVCGKCYFWVRSINEIFCQPLPKLPFVPVKRNEGRTSTDYRTPTAGTQTVGREERVRRLHSPTVPGHVRRKETPLRLRLHGDSRIGRRNVRGGTDPARWPVHGSACVESGNKVFASKAVNGWQQCFECHAVLSMDDAHIYRNVSLPQTVCIISCCCVL